jgi:hypothetical protein
VAYRTNQGGHLRLDRELVRKKLLQNHYMLPNPNDVRDLLLAPPSPAAPLTRGSGPEQVKHRRSSRSAPPADKTERPRSESSTLSKRPFETLNLKH